MGSAQTLYSGLYILYITKQGRNYCRLLHRQWYYATKMYRDTHLEPFYLRLGIVSSSDLLKFPRKKLIDLLNSSEMSILSSSCFLLDGQPVEFATSVCESREELPVKIFGQYYLAGKMYFSLPSLSDRYLQHLVSKIRV